MPGCRGGSALSDFTALFVETPAFSAMKVEDKKRLQDNVHLARQLGLSLIHIYATLVSTKGGVDYDNLNKIHS